MIRLFLAAPILALCSTANAGAVGTYTLKMENGFSLQFVLTNLVAEGACEGKGKLAALVQMYPSKYPMEATRAGYSCWHASNGTVVFSEGRLTSTMEKFEFSIPTSRVVIEKEKIIWKDWGINTSRENPPSARRPTE